MKIKSLIAIIVAGVSFASCQTKPKTAKTPNGTVVNFIKKGNGAVANDSLVSLLNLKYSTDKGHVIFETKPDMPQPIKITTTMPNTDNEVMRSLSLLSVGDSASFEITADEFFTKLLMGAPRPDSIAAESKIKFDVGYVDQMTEQAYFESMKKKQQEAAAKQLKIDDEVIEKYLATNNINAKKTESGLRYVITQEGNGEKPATGQMVKVHYAGKLLDGQLFDTSIESVAKANNSYQAGRDYSTPFEFALGQGQVIKGWDEGIALLSKGAKATLYVPSPLGYGGRSAGPMIKPNSILVFDVELVDFQ